MTVKYQLEHQIPQHVLTGNECADALAKRGAKLARVRPEQLTQVKRFDEKVAKVRRRLLAVQELVLTECGPDRAVEEEGRRDPAVCAKRRRGTKRRAGDIWVNAEDFAEPAPPCPPPPAEGCCSAAARPQQESAPSPDAPLKTPSGVARERREQAIDAVRVRAHPSHNLRGNMETVWCTACCSVTSVGNGRLNLLAGQCRHKCTQRARARVDQLERGQNPLAEDRVQKRLRSQRPRSS